jgi:hypothetical protein
MDGRGRAAYRVKKTDDGWKVIESTRSRVALGGCLNKMATDHKQEVACPMNSRHPRVTQMRPGQQGRPSRPTSIPYPDSGGGHS